MRGRNLILVFLLIFLILPLIWVIINLEGPNKKSIEEVNLSNSTEQSNIYEDQEKLLKFLYDNEKRILENKKAFLIDVTDVLPVIEERDMNNSTVQPDLNIVKSERQKQYEIIKKVLREAVITA